MVTTFDPGRMIWHGYTGAAGWMFRQALEGVLGLRLVDGVMVAPADAVADRRPGPAPGRARPDREPACPPRTACGLPRSRSTPNRPRIPT